MVTAITGMGAGLSNDERETRVTALPAGAHTSRGREGDRAGSRRERRWEANSAPRGARNEVQLSIGAQRGSPKAGGGAMTCPADDTGVGRCLGAARMIPVAGGRQKRCITANESDGPFELGAADR